MTEKLYYHEEGTKAVRSWVLARMLEGAGWAAVFVVGLGVVLWALYGIGLLLPEESKTAPDPNQRGAIMVPATTDVA